jgi:hypothetical protein
VTQARVVGSAGESKSSLTENLAHTRGCCALPRTNRAAAAAAAAAGDSGLGKTTFIENLTSSYKMKSAASEAATTLAAFQACVAGCAEARGGVGGGRICCFRVC